MLTKSDGGEFSQELEAAYQGSDDVHKELGEWNAIVKEYLERDLGK